MPQPTADRPMMPDYGLQPATAGLLPWSWATTRLAAARNYWLATVRPDGHPHLMAVWGLWLDDAFYFSTEARSRKAQNLAANATCVVSPDGADEAVVVEGQAQVLAAGPLHDRVVALYEAKYDMTFPAPAPVYAVRPQRVFGFIEAAAVFPATATRWTFAAPGGPG